ncbi:cupin domain-containing protein [Sessilibacter corallicola]|uniref:Cupin domain-containing protein n=1 Tax=Sessilibacter corallicola TaxID=2904075 RepID=A0ABQ0A6N3_9GAMM
MTMKKINLAEKLSGFEEQWTPKIIAESNGQLVKLAKGSGELIWHAHKNEDELFLVVKGKLTIKLRQENSELEAVELNPGELFVVPKGVEHCPIAEDDTHFLMIEPASTEHTGEHKIDVTVAQKNQAWI